MEFLFSCSIRYLTRSLRSLVRYRVEHSKRNSISPRAHVLLSIYFHLSKGCHSLFQSCLLQHTRRELSPTTQCKYSQIILMRTVKLPYKIFLYPDFVDVCYPRWPATGYNIFAEIHFHWLNFDKSTRKLFFSNWLPSGAQQQDENIIRTPFLFSPSWISCVFINPARGIRAQSTRAMKL